ncbi:MAG: hypothetical protein Q7S84_04760 [bacterium]|nr:hypothetical protein [bacterium]
MELPRSKARRLLVARGESNAGAMFRQQAEPRGGAQPEERDGATRGEGDPPWGYKTRANKKPLQCGVAF